MTLMLILNGGLLIAMRASQVVGWKPERGRKFPDFVCGLLRKAYTAGTSCLSTMVVSFLYSKFTTVITNRSSPKLYPGRVFWVDDSVWLCLLVFSLHQTG